MRLVAPLFVFVLLSLASATNLDAGVMTWQFKNVVFSDGGTLNGTFDFDPDDGVVGTYSNFNITSSAGTDLGAATYGVPVPFSPGDSKTLTAVPTQDVIAPPPMMPPPYFTQVTTYLLIRFNSPLTNAGGTVEIDSTPGISIEGTMDEDGVQQLPFRFVTRGNVMAVQPVPEPSSFSIAAFLLLIASSAKCLKRKLLVPTFAL